MFLFWGFSSLSPQTEHHTATEAEVHNCVKNLGPTGGVTLYPSTESSVFDRKTPTTADFSAMDTHRGFVQVLNCGTPEYERVAAAVESIPWQGLYDTYYHKVKKGSKDKNRGNFQVSFGYACGQCHEKRTPANIRQHAGCAVPGILSDTETDLIQQTFHALGQILTILGAAWTCEEYLDRNPHVRERLQYFAKNLSVKEFIKFLNEQMSLAFFEVVADSAVTKHVDKQNCGVLTEGGLLNKVIKGDNNK